MMRLRGRQKNLPWNGKRHRWWCVTLKYGITSLFKFTGTNFNAHFF